MFAVQDHYGYLSDEALAEAAALLGMTPLELDELATFYTFTFREPVGKYVIHVCDSVVCWMNGYESVRDYLCRRLAIGLGETTADGLFTLLPVCCIGYCDRSPAMLVNRRVHGELTPEKIDEILESAGIKPRRRRQLRDQEDPEPDTIKTCRRTFIQAGIRIARERWTNETACRLKRPLEQMYPQVLFQNRQPDRIATLGGVPRRRRLPGADRGRRRGARRRRCGRSSWMRRSWAAAARPSRPAAR
ncbi:MAG: NADH-quinone oxidoreductase subunit NuoE [Desulfobacterales bacterium]|nr:NADH-quinone oxidoreductase subunit NuoE [Desulfobacterales bacterium]